MWRKRKSALFFDFENVPTKVSPGSIASLVAWLEDGRFDEPGGRRNLVAKRIYWNSAAEKHREVFEEAGFEVVLCEKFAAMKNGADIRIALDVAETCWKVPEIKEYILLTTDSDFVPVLQRLTEKSKTSAILADEAKMSSHTAFKIFADVVVPKRALGEALTYQRPKRNLLGGLRKSQQRPVPSPAHAAARPLEKNGAAHPEPPAIAALADDDPMAQAERAVMRVTSQTPKKHAARRKIERELHKIKEFKTTGAKAYLGKKHYQGLMLEIGRRNARIKVMPGRGEGASVMYVPQD